MGDRELNKAPKVTDMAYVPVVMADGSIGQIAKADLASVVAERFMFGALTSSTDVNNIKGFGFYSSGGIQNSSLPTPYGILMCFQTKGWYDRIQIFFPTDSTTAVFFRFAPETGSFGTWRKLIITV